MTEPKFPDLSTLPGLEGLKIAKPQEVGRPKSILLYGAPGTRKTTLSGGIVKVPGFKRVLYIDVDNGSEVFVNDAQVYDAVQEGRITIVQLDKTDTAATVDALGKLLGFKDENGQKVIGAAFSPSLGYDVVILDALDVAQEVMVDFYLSTTFSESGKRDTLKAWGKVTKWTTDLAWEFQNSKPLGILVAHSKEEVAEGTGRLAIKPKLSGGAKDSIAGVPSTVAYLEFVETEEGTKLAATIGDDSVIVAKNRYSINDKILDFTLPGFFAMVDEREAETKARIAQVKKPVAAVPAAA